MSNARIMVVEDEPVVMKALSILLRNQGYEVVGAGTVAQAMALIRTQQPDLLILDLTLLDSDPFGGLSDGFAFLQLLQRTFPANAFPVIIHTADASVAVQRRAQAMGVASVFRKGDDLNLLLNAVATALAQRQASEAA